MVRKSFLLSFVLFLIACGVKKNPPTVEHPLPSEICKQAWKKYDAGEFEEAYALFDSAITLDAFYQEAYYGKGWTSIQLSKFDDAISAYSFTLILYSFKKNFERVDAPTFNEIFGEEDTWRWGIDSMLSGNLAIWHVKVGKVPLLGYSSVKIKKGSKFVEPTYFDINDSLIFFKDTLYPKVADPIKDTFFLNYYYLSYPSISLPDTVYLSYLGLLGSYVAKESYLSAIIAGNVLRYLASRTLKFDHYPYTTYEKGQALLAYVAFKMDFMNFCVNVLEQLDPSWNFPDTLDPRDPDCKEIILDKINEYLGGNF